MWHQDGGIQNHDLETHPRPRMSVKVAYFLSDVSEPGRGNFSVLPGSHLRDVLDRPADDDNDLAGAVPVLARPGTAVAVRPPSLAHARREPFVDHAEGAVLRLHVPMGARPRRDLASRPSSSGRSRRSARSCWAPARARSAIGCRPTTTLRSARGGRQPEPEAQPVFQSRNASRRRSRCSTGTCSSVSMPVSRIVSRICST